MLKVFKSKICKLFSVPANTTYLSSLQNAIDSIECCFSPALKQVKTYNQSILIIHFTFAFSKLEIANSFSKLPVATIFLVLAIAIEHIGA